MEWSEAPIKRREEKDDATTAKNDSQELELYVDIVRINQPETNWWKSGHEGKPFIRSTTETRREKEGKKVRKIEEASSPNPSKM